MGVEADAKHSRTGNATIGLPCETERGQVLLDASEIRADYPRNKSVHALFEEQAAFSPHAVAIEFEHTRMSYRELNDQANRVARRLIGLGVGKGTLVGLCMERSPELIVGLIAILKAGGAYVPLDPHDPDRRLSFMIRDTSTPVIVAHRPTAGRLAPALRQARVFWIDSGQTIGDDLSATNPGIAATADDLAYVIYTSGSTGAPKGVMITHRGVVRLVRNTNYCQFGPAEVFLQLAPISFDASTFEIWGALLNGGRLAIMPPRSEGLDELGFAIRRHGVTTLWLTADLFNLMVERRIDVLRPVRQLLAGGDVLSPLHVQKALDILEDGVVINAYGPTESTTFACCYRMKKGNPSSGSIPIGRPISHTTVHILDDERRPVRNGSSGELWIGGDGLARGYLNQPELTRQQFVADPFSAEPGARLYRTGDLARLRPDGNIEFLGRIDQQVKILGHRIEPGEIEAALSQHPDVRQSAVVAAAGPRGEKRLVAYVVGVNPASEVQAALLKDYLARRLAAFMIPSVFVNLNSLPLSPNGKVDRSALPPVEELGSEDTAPAGSLTQRPGTAQTISEVWRHVLNRGVGPDNNSFHLGGDSLQLIKK